MNFNIRVYVRVKFRAFGFTFGTVEKQFAVSASTTGQLAYVEEPILVPATAKLLLDQRGVLLKVW